MNKTVSFVLQLLLFVPAVFVFMVLIEYGPRNFSENAALEWRELADAASGN